MTEKPKLWTYEIKHGPDGEAEYAWVLDENGSIVCTTKTHHAIKIVYAVRGEPIPDEPIPVSAYSPA